MYKTLCGTFLIVLLCANNSRAGDFVFANSTSGLTGLVSSTLIESDIQLSIAVGATGAVFDESNSDGLGIDSSGISGALDANSSKFNVLGGTGQGESLTFSFSENGILDKLGFDGLKDEPLEYFSLELPNGSVLSLFDFEVEMRLNDQGFQLSDLGVPNPTMSDGHSDDFSGLAIPFAAGEIFKLTYGEIDYDGSVLPGYYPADDNLIPTGDIANGSRFEGISATVVPEPGSLTLALLAGCSVLRRRRV